MEILSGFLVEERSLSYQLLRKRRTHVSCIRERLISAAPYVSLATVTALARREELLEFGLSSQPTGGEARDEVPAIKAGPGCPVSCLSTPHPMALGGRSPPCCASHPGMLIPRLCRCHRVTLSFLPLGG